MLNLTVTEVANELAMEIGVTLFPLLDLEQEQRMLDLGVTPIHRARVKKALELDPSYLQLLDD